jgi:hypothetical protein
LKRRFRQKQDLAPKEDPENDKGVSNDEAQDNIDIDDVIREIETQLNTHQNAPEEE